MYRTLFSAECEHLLATKPADAIAGKVHRLLVDPEEKERPGKTGEYGLSVVLDSPWLT